MQLAARSCITAAAALAVGSVIAVTPALTPSLPDLQTRAVALTAADDPFSGVVTDVESLFNGGGVGSISDLLTRGSPADTLQELIRTFNTNLVTGELGFNNALRGGELQFEQTVFGSDSALNGVVNRSFNVFNMFIDANERGFNGIIGAPDGILAAHANVADVASPFAGNNITDSLILGHGSGLPFDQGDIGGLEGMFGQGYMAFTDFLGLLGGDGATGMFSAFDPTELLGSADPLGLLTALNPLDFVSLLGI